MGFGTSVDEWVIPWDDLLPQAAGVWTLGVIELSFLKRPGMRYPQSTSRLLVLSSQADPENVLLPVGGVCVCVCLMPTWVKLRSRWPFGRLLWSSPSEVLQVWVCTKALTPFAWKCLVRRMQTVWAFHQNWSQDLVSGNRFHWPKRLNS